MSDPCVTLYHATDVDALDSIRAEGLRSHSYWTSNAELAAYYQEALEDEGKDTVLLAMKVPLPLDRPWAPDFPGLEEPICTVIGLSEEKIREAWDPLSADEETAQASLDLIGSVRCEAPILADRLLLVEMGMLGEDTFEPLVPPAEAGAERKSRPRGP